jgi:hypothetical protein
MIDRALDRPAPSFSRTSGPVTPTPAFAKTSDVTQLIEPVEQLVLQYPAVALASAFLVGVALACWIKRK